MDQRALMSSRRRPVVVVVDAGDVDVVLELCCDATLGPPLPHAASTRPPATIAASATAGR